VLKNGVSLSLVDVSLSPVEGLLNVTIGSIEFGQPPTLNAGPTANI
jgi:hypothetical protein